MLVHQVDVEALGQSPSLYTVHRIKPAMACDTKQQLADATKMDGLLTLALGIGC